MKNLLLKPVKRLFIPIKQRAENYLESRKVRRRKIILHPEDKIALSYAGMLPDFGTVVHGGRVKLAHLGEIYPEQDHKFNILYLVSSALPPYAEEWVYACKKSGVKIVWNQNGVGYPAWAGQTFEQINRPMHKLIHLSDWVIYQSEFCKVSADKFIGSFYGPYSIIFNCVNTSIFIPRHKNLPSRPIKLLVMGSHYQPERITLAIETLVILIEKGMTAELTIAGRLLWPGAYIEINNLINTLGLEKNIFYRGPYLQEEAPNLYREAHILLHFKHNDPCPTVPIEAMACGVPVVGSKSGGVPELLGELGGITPEVKQSWEKRFYPSPNLAADAVITIMQGWSSWSLQARKRGELFDYKKWLEEHQQVFKNCLT